MDCSYLDRNTVVQCPYDSNHKIAQSRIQIHLVKCEKQHPENFREICPFNATHRFPKSDMQEHINNCPSQRHSQPELYQKYVNCGSIKSCPPSEIDIDECWEDDSDSVFKADSSSYFNNSASYVSKYERFEANVRAPRGFAEVDMLDSSVGSSALDEMGSVISSGGMGRGSATINREKMLQKVGRGRGKPKHCD
ncbi:gametocyte-specific factor 1 [Leptopilina boulardi]|uniref:gametocyte-specific factor 1 n=1 Tax=Leptopilina boulardi TaxID=63433 RepID=UPI0021F65962|nr:gametocyte-specific factor 1 [Leptopilina boulardi]